VFQGASVLIIKYFEVVLEQELGFWLKRANWS
jgi:hypothetical protein